MKVILLAALFSLTIHDMMSPTSASYGTPCVQSRIFPGKNPKIKGGKVVAFEEYPWKATLLHIYGGIRQGCSATLIDGKKVITAASCVLPLGGNTIVKLGDTRCRKKFLEVDVGILNIKIPQFKGPLHGNDIAILDVSHASVPPSLTQYIKPVHLPTIRPSGNKKVPPIGTKLTYVGWRNLEFMSIEMKSLSNSDARKVLKNMMKNSNTFQGIKTNPVFKSIVKDSESSEEFQERLLHFVKISLLDTDYIFTKKEKGFGPCGGGGGLFYHEKTQGKGKKSVILGGVISFYFSPCHDETLIVSTRLEAFCEKHGSFCPGSRPGQHQLA